MDLEGSKLESDWVEAGVHHNYLYTMMLVEFQGRCVLLETSQDGSWLGPSEPLYAAAIMAGMISERSSESSNLRLRARSPGIKT